MWKRGRAHVAIEDGRRGPGPPEASGGHGPGNDLPVMPGPEKPLLHIAIEFVEDSDTPNFC